MRPWLLLIGLACAPEAPAGSAGAEAGKRGEEGAMKLVSDAFQHGGALPVAFTCEGKDVSPPLRWLELPAGTAALALIVDDPDAPDPAAPKRTWVHWVAYDLPPGGPGLAEGGALPTGARAGTNDWGRTGWGGPCPPIGRHRYFFKLYALDAPLGDLGPLTKADLVRAMQGHVLGEAELVGTYQKSGR